MSNINTRDKKNKTITIIGMGFVGSYLAKQIVKNENYFLYGYDSDPVRKRQLSSCNDPIGMLNINEMKALAPTSNPTVLGKSDIIIVCVPTPLKYEEPDYSYVESAFGTINKFMDASKMPLIILESSVGIGKTYDAFMNLFFYHDGIDYYMAYSPERVMPGSNTKQPKIVAADNNIALEKARYFYETIGFTPVISESIAVAEAAKLLENTQKYINVQFLNEQQDRLRDKGIDIHNVLDLMDSRDDTPKYRPGLVGGHCIPIDPTYLEKSYNHLSDFIKISNYNRSTKIKNISTELVEYIRHSKATSLLFLGITYKPNVPDIRESGVIEIMKSLYSDWNIESTFLMNGNSTLKINYYDPVYFGELPPGGTTGLNRLNKINKKYDIVIYAVDHTEFKRLELDQIGSKLFDLTGTRRGENVKQI